LTAMMQVARLHGLKDMRVETVPVPEPGPGELLVRVEACGLCSTDARKYRIGVRDGRYPFNPGHEWLGTVESVGLGVDGWSPGERAYGDTYGGYAEYAVVSAAPGEWSCGAMAIQKEVPRNRAVFLEPLADCLHGVLDQGRVREGDQVVVFSAGSMGLQLAALATRAGGRVIVVEPIQARRELALTFGAETAVAGDGWKDAVLDWTNGHGPDVAIVAVGRGDLVAAAVDVAAPGGRVVAFAGFGDEATGVIDLNRIHYREVTLVGSEWIGAPPNQRWERYGQARDLLTSGDLPLEDLVTRIVKFDQVAAALDGFAGHQELKTVLVPGDDS
jgi:L-iditol 2-dehydrogenase